MSLDVAKEIQEGDVALGLLEFLAEIVGKEAVNLLGESIGCLGSGCGSNSHQAARWGWGLDFSRREASVDGLAVSQHVVETCIASRTVTVKPVGAHSFFGSSEKLYCVLAMQTGTDAKPAASSFLIFVLTPGAYETEEPP